MLLLAALVTLPGHAIAVAAATVNTEGGTALGGYDPVAYFTAGRPVLGQADISAQHDGATYLFATEANRARFLADPATYLPQYGGWCAYGMARGYKAVVDPRAFAIVEGRLYLNYNAAIQALWRLNTSAEVARADANWPQVRHSADIAR
jgi:YHS domain-containing protein